MQSCRLWKVVTLVSACVVASGVSGRLQGGSALITGSDWDPVAIMDEQFSSVPAITSSSDADDVCDWLDTTSEIMGRMALGALPLLPPNALVAAETLCSEIASSSDLIQDTDVLKKVLSMLPSLWGTGFWYKPVDEWEPVFSCSFAQAVAAAQASGSGCYDAAVEATALMIRFTKDTVFPDGKDHGDSEPLQGSAKSYMAYLPDLVAQVAKRADFSLTEEQLRSFMDSKMASKTDGMDMSVDFPVYVDTSKFKDADIAALDQLLSA